MINHHQLQTKINQRHQPPAFHSSTAPVPPEVEPSRLAACDTSPGESWGLLHVKYYNEIDVYIYMHIEYYVLIYIDTMSLSFFITHIRI